MVLPAANASLLSSTATAHAAICLRFAQYCDSVWYAVRVLRQRMVLPSYAVRSTERAYGANTPAMRSTVL
eukprot:3941989-Rhodomonas_salina.2